MKTILVIDDEPSVLAAFEQVLKAGGHKVLLAGDGSEGLRRYQEETVDLVVTDMFMPEQDGIQVITELRKKEPKLPIIAMTGNPKGNTLAIAQKLGAVAVFEKPFDASELLDAIANALKQSQS